MRPLEAVADAIMAMEGWRAGSFSNRNRNPGNLRDSALKIGEDPAGFAVFADFPTGYRALVHLLQLYFSGQNAHSIGPQSTLADLFAVYAPSSDHNSPLAYAAFVATWISTALNKPYTSQSKLGDICPVVDATIPVGLEIESP